MIPYRYAFISGSGFYTAGVAFGTFVLFYTFYLTSKPQIKWTEIITLIPIYLASILAARTSFLAIFFSIFFLALKEKRKFAFLLLVIFTIIFLHLETISSFPYYNWIFEIFSNDKSSTSKEILLEDMLYMPELKQLIIGDARHKNHNGDYYGGSDSGFLRNIFLSGLTFLILNITMLLILCKKQNRILYAAATFITMVAFHIKGEYFFNNAQAMAVFYLFYAYLCLPFREPLKTPKISKNQIAPH